MISLALVTHAPTTKNTLSHSNNNHLSSTTIIGCHKPVSYSKFSSASLSKYGRLFSSASVSTDHNVVAQQEEVEHQVPEGLRADRMPNHVALIMDGNSRWAKERNLAPMEGHRAGKRVMHQLRRLCSKWGIKAFTVFAFSTENWRRPKEEVDFLMHIIEEMMTDDLDDIMSHNSKLSVIGNKWMLPMSLQDATARAEDYTKYNTGTQFNVAVNYGGRYDILQACKSIAKKTKEGVLQVNEISEQIFEQELETKCVTEFSNPDLLIRTSGELRISNFLLWQLAYTELYFVEKKFPDFGEADFIEALRTYEKRRKRYGGH